MTYGQQRRMLGTLLSTIDKASQQGMVTFFLAKPREVLHNTVSQKIDAHILWDCRGPILKHYMSTGITVNRKAYCDLHENHFKSSVKSKYHSLIHSGVLLQHVKMQYHMTCATAKKKLRICIWSVVHILHIHLTSHNLIGLCLEVQ